MPKKLTRKACVPVRIGGIWRDAYMIDGVLRFRENAVVRDLVNAGLIDLNEVGQRVETEGLPLRDAVEFWMMLGYSVEGLADVFPSIAISTPAWTRPGKLFPKEKT